jgi:hypothetical protein
MKNKKCDVWSVYEGECIRGSKSEKRSFEVVVIYNLTLGDLK